MNADSKETFDEYAAEYDIALNQGLSVSGEKKDYFARRRVEWLRYRLQRESACADHIMDYGCGIGSTSPLLIELLGAKTFLGTDMSPKSLEIATQLYGSVTAKFLRFDQYWPDNRFDLVYCNGVFHHITLSERASAVSYIFRSIRPGGFLAFWENNPWNPGTRLVMSRIPFDRDAITITAPRARTLLQTGGFEILHTDFLFIFPHILSCLRWIEPSCIGFPLGAQYLIIARKPAACRRAQVESLQPY